MLGGVDDGRVGAAFRAVRVRRGWRQLDVAEKAGVSASLVSDIERGHCASLSLDKIRRIAGVLEIRVDLTARWRAGELDRLLNARHNALTNLTAEWLIALGWQVVPEASFAIAGERGLIDLLAWHPETRTLLIIEVKTEIVDVQEMIGTVDRKTRLARQIARSRGWYPTSVGRWIAVADSSMNRDRATRHSALITAAYPSGGASIRRWIRRPDGPVSALSFISARSFRNFAQGGAKGSLAARKRVRPRPSPGSERAEASDLSDAGRNLRNQRPRSA